MLPSPPERRPDEGDRLGWLLDHEPLGKPEDPEAVSAELAIAPPIGLRLLDVIPTIDLDDEPGPARVEIDDVAPERHLPPKRDPECGAQAASHDSARRRPRSLKTEKPRLPGRRRRWRGVHVEEDEVVKDRGAGCQWRARRRPELREPPPPEAPLEERDALAAPELLRPAEEDLIRRPAAVGRVRPMTVVEDREVDAEPVELPHAPQQPDIAVPEDRRLERPEQPLDSAVGPSMGRLDEDVLRAMGG